MLKVLVILIASFTITSSYAQIANSRWKATLNIEGLVNVIFDFKKDTVSLYTVADSTIIETMTYTNDATSLTVTKIEGESDCDNNMPGQYSYIIQGDVLLIKVITDGCEDRSSAIDSTRWTKWKDPHEVKVDDAILKQYAGVYQLDEAHPITISFEDGKLYAEGPNNRLPKSSLMAESDTKFFLKVAGVRWDFLKDTNGKVTGFISHEEKDDELKKVK